MGDCVVGPLFHLTSVNGGPLISPLVQATSARHQSESSRSLGGAPSPICAREYMLWSSARCPRARSSCLEFETTSRL